MVSQGYDLADGCLSVFLYVLDVGFEAKELGIFMYRGKMFNMVFALYRHDSDMSI